MSRELAIRFAPAALLLVHLACSSNSDGAPAGPTVARTGGTPPRPSGEGGSAATGGATSAPGTGGAADAAAPGTGGMTGAGGSSPTDVGIIDMAPAPDVPLPECNYPEWSKDTEYKPGDIVMFMGKPYIALYTTKSHDPTISTFYWGPFTGCVLPPPAKCAELDRLLPDGEVTFKALFAAPFMLAIPKPEYSYTSLCKALATPSLSGFARSGNAMQDKRELAAFFANVAIETAYLTFTDEGNRSPQSRGFHGRGSLQITTPAIYAEVGQGLGLNLVAMPELASKEVVVWQTGLWYWLHHANPSVGAPNVCRQAIAASDFGRTVRIIHPTCGRAAERAAQYRKNCMLLGVPEPGKTSCP